ATVRILGGPYLSGLTQYGSSGTARLGGGWQDNTIVPSTVTAYESVDPSHAQQARRELQDYLRGSTARHNNNPGSTIWQGAPIYVVVSDPSVLRGNYGGFNSPGDLSTNDGSGNLQVGEAVHMIWIGTGFTFAGSGVWKDGFTEVLSHELAETMSDPDPNDP